MEERTHSELGGSTANRWLNCTASVSLLRGLPPSPASEAAEEGTKAHSIAEMLLEDFLTHKLDGSDPEIRAHLLSENEEMLEHARGFRDAIWKEVFEEALTGKAYGQEDEFVFSKELKAYGFIDFWCVYTDDRGKRVGAIVDYKYGFNHVEAEGNDQLLFYACALREFFLENGKDLDIVRCAIYQPRDGHEKSYREVSYTAKKLDLWKKKAIDAGHAIYVSKKVKFKVGKWCRWCQAQAICPTYQKELDKKTSLKLLEPEKEILIKPESLSDETLVKIVEHYDSIVDYFKACKKFALSKALNGGIKGLKVIHGPTRRKWKDEEKVIVELANILENDEVYKSKLRGITEIEKTLKKKIGKAESDVLMESIVDRTTPPLLLVPDSDSRPAVAGGVDLLSVFEEQIEE